MIGSQASLVRYHLKDVACKKQSSEPPGHLEGERCKHGDQQEQSPGAGLHVAEQKGGKQVSSVLGTLIRKRSPFEV